MLFSSLFSGSSGNASLLEAGNTRILIDAGLAGNRIEQALTSIGIAPETLSAILVTHEHTDHVRGVGVLSRRYSLPVYANAACFDAMSGTVGEIKPSLVRIFQTGCDFYLGGVNILPFSIPHDAAEPVGYVLSHESKSVGVLTDIGHMDEHLYDAVENCSLLLLEANHDVDMLNEGSYPYLLKRRILSRNGHLSNEDSARALCKLYTRGLRNAILGHLSAENNDERVAMATVKGMLKHEGIEGMRVMMSHRDRPCGVFHIG